MLTQNLSIKKGAIIAYRLYDIAHEIDLKKAEALLTAGDMQSVQRYKLKNNPLRSIVLKEAPLTISGDMGSIEIKIDEDKTLEFDYRLEIKVWNYGVVSLRYKLILDKELPWMDLVKIGAILDSDSIIDKMATKKRDELTTNLFRSLENPHTHSTFEDYTTYLVEELELSEKDSKKSFVKHPLEILKTTGIAALLLAEPTKTLSETTHKSIQSNYSQYTKEDLLIMDWNSALVLDLGKTKESQDYVDIIEFSLAQLLELRIYDELLDEKQEELYDSVKRKRYKEDSTEAYSKISEESGELYMEFSDFFEKLDNSIKTVGDAYLAKILRNADKKFGFDELKKSMSRKIESLLETSKLYQEKVNKSTDDRNITHGHRLEWIVIVLIAVEVFPSLYTHIPDVIKFFSSIAK